MINKDTPSANLIGFDLIGQKRDGHWTPIERISNDEGTGGTFSVAYKAKHSNGSEAFLKATDVGLLTRADSQVPLLDRMSRAASEQSFERRVLDFCSGNNMDRVVTALDYGDREVEHGGVRDIVFFIVFEKALGDVRSSALAQERETPSWFLRALHNIAVGVNQLHQQGIAHNDIKPSNVLVFTEAVQKLGDLGRATADNINGPWDEMICVGDRTYVPPELWGYKIEYTKQLNKVAFSSRAPADVYLLGSMGYFFLSGAPLTPILQNFIQPQHQPVNWTEDYSAVLPYLIDAHASAMALLPEAISGNWDSKHQDCLLELVPLIRALTSPDPVQRGDPANTARNLPKYDLQRVTSLFDLLSKKVLRN